MKHVNPESPDVTPSVSNKYYLTLKPFLLDDAPSHLRLSGRVVVVGRDSYLLNSGAGLVAMPLIRAACDDKWIFSAWYWYKDELQEITEEQALDPNFRKFMYKLYSGDPNGELNEIL